MKALLKLVIISGLISTYIFAQVSVQEEVKSHLKNLPFAMNVLSIPSFPDRQFNILQYGAKGDALFKNTEAFKKAISECNSQGGGHVIVPSGMWITGPIELMSNVDLHLEKGALVIFSDDHDDYPLLQTSAKSFDVMNPIYGRNLENVAITGEGIFDGNGEIWRPVKKSKLTVAQWNSLLESGGVVSEKGDMWWPSKQAMNGEKYLAERNKGDLTKADYETIKDYFRPYMLSLERCTNIFLDSFTLQNSPKFAMNLRYCENIILRQVKVMNEWWFQNGDGLDLSACKNVLMYGCIVNAGDDAICLKSSGGKPDSFAMENIVIRDCVVYHGHGGFVIGSNTDGGIRNVSVKNCNFIWTDTGLRFKSGVGRGGRVENIFIEDIMMKNIQEEAITFDMFYSDAGAAKMKDDKIVSEKIPRFKNVYMKNVFVDGAKKIFYSNSLENYPIENISLNNSVFRSNEGFDIKASVGFSFEELKVSISKGVAFRINKSQKITMIGLTMLKPVKSFVEISDKTTKEVVVSNSKFKAIEESYLFTNGADKNSLISK